MMLLASASLLLASFAPQWIDAGERISPEEAVALVSDCGATHAAHEYSDLMQDVVLTLPEETELDDEQVTCLARVSFDSGYDIEVPEALISRYWAARDEVSRPWAEELARDRLADNGQLESVPPFDPDTMSDEEYARRLEAHCGPDAKGALSSDFGPHAVSPEWSLSFSGDYVAAAQALACLLNSATVAGFNLYLIGNEKVAEPD